MWSPREKGGRFLPTQGPRCVQWHQSLSPGTGFTAGMYESDQPLMRGQWKRLPKTTWKHASSLQTWFSSEMTYFITFPRGSGPKKASISLLMLTGDDGMSRNRPSSFTTSFPLSPAGLTRSRTDLFSAPNLFSLRRFTVVMPDPWLPSSFSFSSPSSSASNFHFAWFVSNCCSVLLCSVSVSSLTFSIFPLFLYFLSIAHCLCEALSWPNAWLRPRWLKAAQGMARLMFSFFFTRNDLSFVLFIRFAASQWPFFFSFRLGCSINVAFGPDPNQTFPNRKLNHWQSTIYWLFPEDELYQIIILCGRPLLCFPPAFFPLYWEVMLICVCLSG